VYATEPVVAIARHWMKELLGVDAASRSSASENGWPPRTVQGGPAQPDRAPWRCLYRKHDVQASLSKVRGLHYSQETALMGGIVRVTPVVGGSALGSACWVITGGGRKIVYLGAAGTPAQSPAAELDVNPLRDADVLLLPHLAPEPHASDPMELMRAAVLKAVQANGSVLLPVHPGGAVLHLLETVEELLKEAGSSVPIYYVSPASGSVVAHANISMEWLNVKRQNRVYDAQEPFEHMQMKAAGRLHLVSGLHQLQMQAGKSCVVFVPHSSLRAGPAAHLLREWSQEPNNLLVLTESCATETDKLLAPYRPMNMQVVHAPTDPRLTPTQASKLLETLKPGVLVVSEPDHAALKLLPPEQRTALGLDAMITFQHSVPKPVSVPLPSTAVPTAVSPELAQSIQMTKLDGPPSVSEDGGLRAARVCGHLIQRDGRYGLVPIEKNSASAFQSMMHNKCILWGQPQVMPLKLVLEQQGFDWVTLDSEFSPRQKSNGMLSSSPSPEILEQVAVLNVQLGTLCGKVQLAANATHITSDSHVVRRLLLEAVLGQLNML